MYKELFILKINPTVLQIYVYSNRILKAKKTHGFKSCIVISVYPLDILSIK